jgi:hypothetical protein
MYAYCGLYTSVFAGNQGVAEGGGNMSEMSEEDSFTQDNPRTVSYMLSCGHALQVKSNFNLSNTNFVMLLSCTVHCVLWIWCACPIKRSKKRINHQRGRLLPRKLQRQGKEKSWISKSFKTQWQWMETSMKGRQNCPPQKQ